MRKIFFIFNPLLFISIGVIFVGSNNKAIVSEKEYGTQISDITICGSITNNNIYPNKDGKFIAVLPGWGNYSYDITSKNDSSQIYFNQGLSMYYSYHAREAFASFKEAAKFDSSSAMAYWGQALALGPSYNLGYSYKFNKLIPNVIKLMNLNTEYASPKEKDLIYAMNRRYDVNDSSEKLRNELNSNYAKELYSLISKYPNDLDIKALYTDAVMLIHSWDFWNNDGTPKSWTDELVQFCQDILKQNPHHPAALHYYIHVTEASRKSEVALPSADSLIKLFPGIAHMVHMSSHVYERLGYYSKGVNANEEADRSLRLYDSLAKGLFPIVHVPHYYAVDAYCALSGAMYEKAMSKTMLCRNSVNPTYENTYEQYQYMFPLLAKVRMGKWQDILQDTSFINTQWTYASILNYFAKGMAFSKINNQEEAQKNLLQLQENMKDKILQIRPTPYKSSPFECSVVAENILIANIFFNQKKYNEAIAAINKAILAEDKLIYSEPKIWMLPARQYLGAFLLKLHKPIEAEKVYREDLVWNPGNGWSLLGLYQSLRKQGKYPELKSIKTHYMKSFSSADYMPLSSAF